jgi:hypothetical protein
MDRGELEALSHVTNPWDEPWDLVFKHGAQSVRDVLPNPSFHLRGLHDFTSLETALRDVRLRGDSSVKIYEHTLIQARRLTIANLSPLSLYTLRPRMMELLQLFWSLQARGQNMFDLIGIMDYDVGGPTHRLIPPIIETYQEPTTNKWTSAIIDGLHRVSVARALGLKELWTINITRVPSTLPPIALPVSWEDVVTYEDVPPTNLKRHYRYGHHLEADPANVLGITPENYQYFLYRDFSSLGSAGIRNPS